VVDDSKSARLMLRKMLQGSGLTVDTAESAEEALNYLRDQRPDAIFMDHTMPGMDGLEALQRIRSDPATARIPVAMYTSKDEPSYQEQAGAAGAAGVLIKPATSEALGAILERMNAMLAVAQAPAAAAAPAGETVTPEWVGKLALEKAELVFYDAIESQVLPLVNDVIAKLRRELESGQEEACNRLLKTRLAEWRPPPGSAGAEATETTLRDRLLPLVEQRLEAFRQEGRGEIETYVRSVAAEVCQNQLHELSERLVQQMGMRFAKAVQSANAAAREAAVDAARETALQAVGAAAVPGIAEKGAIETAEQVARQLCADIQRDLKRRIYWAAGWAAAAGIGAAVLAWIR
jgi:CheY-like chemotaxis protein